MYEKAEGQIDAWLEGGREERKREKKKGALPEVSEKKPKNQTSTPESIQKRCPNRPKSCQNRPKKLPEPFLRRGRPKVTKMTPKSSGKGLPGGSQETPKIDNFRIIFQTIFEKAPGPLSDRLQTDSGAILALFWVCFRSRFRTKLDEG